MIIQYSKEFTESVNALNSFKGYKFFQKIYSSSTLVCLSIRLKGHTQYLYLGRGCGVEGVWLCDKKVPVELRKIDRFLEYLRKYLSSAELLDISQVFNDRCLKIVYRRFGKKNAFLFFWKGRTLYFLNYFFDLNKNSFYLMKSWEGKQTIKNGVDILNIHESLYEIGLDQGFVYRSKSSKTSAIAAISEERKKLIQVHCSPKRVKVLQKKISRISCELKKVNSAEILQKKIQQEELDFDSIGKSFEFQGIKINFDGNWNSFKKKDRIFEKIKGYKRARKILENRKKWLEKNIQEGSFKLDKNRLRTTEPCWVFSKRKRSVSTDKSQRRIKVFRFNKSLTFAIGIDASSNDFLRSQWGKKMDFWFHLDGYSGSHLVLRESRWDKVSMQFLRVAASVLRDFSGEAMNEIPLVFTRVKNIKGVKGAKGKIIYRKEKYMKMDYDINWKDYVEEL